MARRLFAIVQDKSQGSSHVCTLNATTVNLIRSQNKGLSCLESISGFLSLQALLTGDNVKHLRTRMCMDRC